MDAATPNNPEDEQNNVNNPQPSGPPEVTNPSVGAEISPVRPPAPAATQPQPVESPVPAATQPVEPPDEVTPEPVSDDPATPATAPAATPAPAPVKPAHGSRPIGAIVVAIIIALLLAGLSIFAYLKTQRSVQPNSNTQSNKPTATAKDADATNEALDKTLGSVDEQDLNDDLGDAAIGL